MRPGGRRSRPVSLVLASRSPQRSAILRQLGVDFEVVVADVEEQEEGDPEEVARANARRKALAVAGDPRAAGAAVLAADTVVSLPGRLLPKPADADEARLWLGALSGREHDVVGGVCLVREGRPLVASARTVVRFRRLTGNEIDWYLSTGEWRERAGGYAIQGRGAVLVAGIEGDYLNVVGLPVGALLEVFPDLLT